MKILHSGTLNPHTHTQTFIYKAQRLTNLSTLAHIIDMLFFISMTLFRFLKSEIAFLHLLFNLVFNWQKRQDSKASTYLNTIPLYPIVWRQRGPGMSTDDKSIHPSQTRVPDMKRGVRSPGMSTARGNLRFVVPFPTAKLPSYHGMLSEDKLSHQFPIKQILATNSITTMRRTNYSSRTMSPLAHFCPIIVCLFVQWVGRLETRRCKIWIPPHPGCHSYLIIVVTVGVVSKVPPYRLHYLGCNPTQSDSYPTLVATRHVSVPR